MPATEIFAIASVVAAVVGGPVYLFDILRHKVKPERTTWFVWTLQSGIGFGSQVVLGAHWSLLFLGLNAAGNLLVFLLSLKYGLGGWKKVDIISLCIAVAGLAASLVTEQPLVALAGAILADFAGTVPTFTKVWRLPDSETNFLWLSFGLSSTLAIFSVGSLNWRLVVYPLYLALDSYAVVVVKMIALHQRSSVKAAKR